MRKHDKSDILCYTCSRLGLYLSCGWLEYKPVKISIQYFFRFETRSNIEYRQMVPVLIETLRSILHINKYNSVCTYC